MHYATVNRAKANLAAEARATRSSAFPGHRGHRLLSLFHREAVRMLRWWKLDERRHEFLRRRKHRIDREGLMNDQSQYAFDTRPGRC